MKGADAMAAVVEQLVAKIEAGAGQWTMPWRSGGFGSSLPHNATTGVEYRGGNIIACWLAADERGYPTQAWATYKQWQAAGAQVRAGEHGLPLVYWDRVARRAPGADDDDSEASTRMVPRVFRVFNAAQVDGYNVAELPVATRPDTDIDGWLASIPFKVQLGAPAYSAVRDVVFMPPETMFDSLPDYYAVLFHELTHWTGHTSRLSRQYGKRFGDATYAAEELVAELGAAFACHHFGINAADRSGDHAAYLASWCSMLRAEPSILWSVASKAQAAFDHLNSYADQHLFAELSEQV